MQSNWDDYRAVLAVVRERTLAAAATDLGVNYTTIARRIARAEQATGERLFERLTEGYRPTEAGQLVAAHAADMEAAEHSLLRGLSGRDQSLRGELTVTAPQLLIAHFLAPALDAFATRHPGVALKLRADNELLDLNRREADLAIRISRDPGDTLKGLRVAEQQTASFAAPAWADRIRDEPDCAIDWLLFEGTPKIPSEAITAFPNSRIHMLFDDMVAMGGAAEEGLGVVRMPMFLGRSLPGLVQVPVLPPQPYAEIWVVAHPDVWPGSKLQAFRDVVIPYFRDRRSFFLA